MQAPDWSASVTPTPPVHLAGSPICAASAEHGGFDYIVCVESRKDRCDVLNRRLESKLDPDKFDVIRGDCNREIDRVISQIQSKYKNPIVLVFVDPQAFEIKFKTLISLVEAFERCDFMIHVHSNAVEREHGKIAKKSHNASPRVLEGLFDMPISEIFPNLLNVSPEQQYADRVQTKLGKQIGDTIKIRNTEDHIVVLIDFGKRSIY